MVKIANNCNLIKIYQQSKLKCLYADQQRRDLQLVVSLLYYSETKPHISE